MDILSQDNSNDLEAQKEAEKLAKKEARKLYQKQWWEDNKERRKGYKEKHRENNLDKIRESERKYYENNKEKRSEAKKQHRKANPEKTKENDKKYHENAKETAKISKKAWREQNKEKIAETSRNYRHSNREATRQIKRKRSLLIASQSDQTMTPEFVDNLFRKAKSCPYCGKKMFDVSENKKDVKSLDHLIPISKGGLHSRVNVVVCCYSCNSKKQNFLFPEWLDRLEEPYRTKAEKLYTKQYGTSPLQGVLPLIFES